MLEQVGGQQCVDRLLGLAQAQHGDDAPLRRVAGREQRAAVREQAGVVGDLALQERRGVGAVEAQDAEEGQQGGVDALGGFVHGRGRECITVPLAPESDARRRFAGAAAASILGRGIFL